MVPHQSILSLLSLWIPRRLLCSTEVPWWILPCLFGFRWGWPISIISVSIWRHHVSTIIALLWCNIGLLSALGEWNRDIQGVASEMAANLVMMYHCFDNYLQAAASFIKQIDSTFFRFVSLWWFFLLFSPLTSTKYCLVTFLLQFLAFTLPKLWRYDVKGFFINLKDK